MIRLVGMEEIAEYIPTIYYSKLGHLAASLPRAPALLINRKLSFRTTGLLGCKAFDRLFVVFRFPCQKTPPRTKDLKTSTLRPDTFLAARPLAFPLQFPSRALQIVANY